MRKTLKVGIATRQAIAQETRDVVAGRKRRSGDIWFTSVENFAKVLSKRNLAAASRRAKSHLSCTLHTMARYGLVRLEKDEGGKIKPVVTFEKVELRLAPAASVSA
jgi:predicted transcriptional regulator